MTDWLIPFGPTGADVEPLRHAMRSIASVDPSPRIVVSGADPGDLQPDVWVQGVARLRKTGRPAQRADSRRNQRRALAHLGETFWLTHDDIFLLGAPPMHTEHGGSLAQNVKLREKIAPQIYYTHQARATLDFLRGLGFRAPRWFEHHRPILVMRDLFAEVLDMIGDEPVMSRTVYANLAHRAGEMVLGPESEDPKVPAVSGYWDESDWCVSASNLSWAGSLGSYVRERFSERSRWEPPPPRVKPPFPGRYARP